VHGTQPWFMQSRQVTTGGVCARLTPSHNRATSNQRIGTIVLG
jgi:hypothetical protein